MAFKLKILTPSTGICRMGYTTSLVRLVAYYVQNRIWPECETQELDFQATEGSGISANRESLVIDAMKTDYTHILFIDEDMSFAPNALHVLASRRQRVVGCNYLIRSKGQGMMALSLDRKSRVPLTPESAGIEPVFYTGFGLCLIERSVFEDLANPWFLIGYNTESHLYSTEDAAFGHLLNDAGIPWYVDHDASKLVDHIGNYTYTWKDISNVTT